MRPPPPREAPPPPAKESLSDTQVLKLLETRRPEGSEPPASDPAHGAIPLLKPDDTGTREALKDAVVSNAPVLFAVQLQWSVQPCELDKVPPLAIFSAYTLYTVEGSRDGRKWYGLRLGFFSDAISAKQVAHYVRSEFTSVAVVPVSPQEKSRATDQDKQAATLGAPAASPSGPVDEFKLIDDDPAAEEVAKLARAPVPAPKRGARAPRPRRFPAGRCRRSPSGAPSFRRVHRPGSAPPPPSLACAVPARWARATSAARSRSRRRSRFSARASSPSTTATARRSTTSGVRHLRVEVQKNSPFSKLLERLSERMKKP